MARYDKEHKRLSRDRIIGAAGRRFKSDGIDGSGVATLMEDAGLTTGGLPRWSARHVPRSHPRHSRDQVGSYTPGTPRSIESSPRRVVIARCRR